MTSSNIKIGLGTAQFGLDYGITNRSGEVSDIDLKMILDQSKLVGIDVLDTAQAYGDAEMRIGKYLQKSPGSYQIISKMSLPADTTLDETIIKNTLQNSLQNLGVDELYGMLAHNIKDLVGVYGEIYWNVLKEFKAKGKFTKIGVSVYNAEEIDLVLDCFDIDLIQLPVNIADQRLIKSGHLSELKNRNIEIHVRSIFLQGILLADQKSFSGQWKSIKPFLDILDEIAGEHKVSRQAIILSQTWKPDLIDKLIVGVSCQSDFKGLIHAIEESSRIQDLKINPPPIDDRLLDPRKWLPK